MLIMQVRAGIWVREGEYRCGRGLEGVDYELGAILEVNTCTAEFCNLGCMSKISHKKLACAGLQMNVGDSELIFLLLNQNICCGYSKEPSR